MYLDKVTDKMGLVPKISYDIDGRLILVVEETIHGGRADIMDLKPTLESGYILEVANDQFIADFASED